MSSRTFRQPAYREAESNNLPLADMEEALGDGPFHGPRALLLVPNADLAMVKALDLFAAKPSPPQPGVHPSAFVDPTA